MMVSFSASVFLFWSSFPLQFLLGLLRAFSALNLRSACCASVYDQTANVLCVAHVTFHLCKFIFGYFRPTFEYSVENY